MCRIKKKIRNKKYTFYPRWKFTVQNRKYLFRAQHNYYFSLLTDMFSFEYRYMNDEKRNMLASNFLTFVLGLELTNKSYVTGFFGYELA